MNHTYLRGDMYYADLGRGIGSEQEGYRPVVIIQNNVGNKHSPTVIIAFITSKTGVKAKLLTHYYIDCVPSISAAWATSSGICPKSTFEASTMRWRSASV